MGDVNNFKFFDDLIHSESENIVLTSDIILDEDEEDQYSRGIEIDLNDLTIDGNGHTIDAMGKARIFKCIWRNILIKNIALNNGLAIDGGAIYNKGNLKIMSSKISRNKSLNNGGAIYNLGEMVLIDSYISACLSKECGGAIYNSRGELEIIDSKIISNTVKDSNFTRGGAIYNDNGRISIKNTFLSRCKKTMRCNI